ncbi:MAG: T9SS type A sorting domain-containing protein, partial [Prolixibacteraceae bacterium]|nr:T9SS type A sorting domain-containing protein [Prolixibacteraceae bacterium]
KVIFVVPDGSAEPFLGSFYTNSALYGNFEDYIAEDLYNEISTNYNTYAERKKWSIMGHSMGGYGCMKIALKNPDDYIGVAALSAPLHITYYEDILPLLLEEHGDAPPYEYTYQGDVTKLIYSMSGAFSPAPDSWPPVIFPVDTMGNVIEDVKNLWEPNNPINFVSDWQGNPELAMYLYCGELDEYRLLSQNQLFSDTLNHYGIEHTFYIDPWGDHISSLIKSMPEGLNFLYNVMTETSSDNDLMEINNRFSIFPNPAKDYIVIDDKRGTEILSAVFYSAAGNVVRRFTSNGISPRKLFTGNLPSGCYIVQFEFRNEPAQRFKFIKN